MRKCSHTNKRCLTKINDDCTDQCCELAEMTKYVGVVKILGRRLLSSLVLFCLSLFVQLLCWRGTAVCRRRGRCTFTQEETLELRSEPDDLPSVQNYHPDHSLSYSMLDEPFPTSQKSRISTNIQTSRNLIYVHTEIMYNSTRNVHVYTYCVKELKVFVGQISRQIMSWK